MFLRTMIFEKPVACDDVPSLKILADSGILCRIMYIISTSPAEPGLFSFRASVDIVAVSVDMFRQT